MNAPALSSRELTTTFAELDLWTVADAAGLNPKGRARNFPFDCPECGRKGKASGLRADGGPWHCFACDAKGNALTLARRFELNGAELPRRVAPTPSTNRNGVAPSTARDAWRAIEVNGEPYRDRLAAYLEGVRGWPAELAAAGAAVPGVAWMPADCPDLPRPLAWMARDNDRRAVFALRDARGEVWTLETRWTNPGLGLRGPKALRLPTRATESGHLVIFGNVPAAVAAAARGEPIYVCEGGPDYLAAAAYARLEGRGAALGAHGHHGLPKVAAALRAGLEAAKVPAARVHILCTPHRGDSGNVGEQSMGEAVAILAGAGAVHIVRVPDAVVGTGKGDLADAARGGARDLRTLFELADLVYAAPVDVRDAEASTEQIRAAMLRALQAADGPNALALVIMPPGAGKTTAAFERAAFVALQGRRVAFLFGTHALAAEKMGEFQRAFPGVHAVHAKGMASLCELTGDPAIKRAAETMGRRMCDGCPLASRNDGDGGTCEGWRQPKARRGTVTFAAHDAAASLMRNAEPADLVIVDELPGLVDVRQIGPGHLKSLESGTFAARPWYRKNPAHGELAAELAAFAARLESETPRGDYAERILWSRLVAELRNVPAALDAAAGVLEEASNDPDPDRPPAPSPDDARRGAADKWPDAGAWKFVRDTARALCNPEADPAAELLCLRLDGAGEGWAFEARSLFELPAGVRVLALDATGTIGRGEWEALAARHGRTLVPVTVTAAGESPRACDFYRTGRLRTGRLWARHARGLSFLADAPGTVRQSILRAAGAVPCALGVLTHKPLADAFRWGVHLVNDPAASPPAGAAFEETDPHARKVAELAANLARDGWDLEIGHFGGDERGTDRFAGVDTLAVIGAPRADWGATEEDARALAIDPAELGKARTLAGTIQALARARHLRRPGVRLFLAADFETPPTGPELPGVAWTVETADRSHAETFEARAAAVAVTAIADREGALNLAAVVAELRPLQVGRRVAERLAREEAARRGWTPRYGQGRGKTYQGPLHRENVNDYGLLYAHGEGVDLVTRDDAEGEALLLDPMSVQKPDFTGESSMHAAAEPLEGLDRLSRGPARAQRPPADPSPPVPGSVGGAWTSTGPPPGGLDRTAAG